MRDERAESHMHTERLPSVCCPVVGSNQRSIYFFSAGFPDVNWLCAPNPNAAGVIPFCPCPVAPKLNGDADPPPVDEGVGGVNVNTGGLEPVISFVVAVVEGVLEENSLFIAGAGMDGVVPNALTGVDVVPNALPFVSGLGLGLEGSCLGAANESVPCEPSVVAGMTEFVDGKAAFGSGPPASLFAAKLNGEGVGCPNTDGVGWLVAPKDDGVGWPVAPNSGGAGCDWVVVPSDEGVGFD